MNLQTPDGSVEVYARTVIEHKVPNLDGERFEKIKKKLDGKNIDLFKGKTGNGYYFRKDDAVYYFTSDKLGDVTELQTRERKNLATAEPGTKKKAAKKTPEKTTFVESDGGRADSSRPKQKSDGSVRVVAIAAGISYDDAFEILKGLGRQSDRVFNLTEHLDGGGTVSGLSTLEFIPNEKTLGEFLTANATGNFIVETPKSIGVVKEGQYFDERFDADAALENVYKVEISKPELTTELEEGEGEVADSATA